MEHLCSQIAHVVSVLTVAFTVGANKYVLELPDCNIPEVPLFGPAILPEWKSPFSSKCDKIGLIGKLSSKMILTRDAVVNENGICCWREIQRPFNLESDGYVLSECRLFNERTAVDVSKFEFLMINCTKGKNGKQYAPSFEFHCNLPTTLASLQKKLKFWEKRHNQFPRPFSVQFLILESTTRPHTLRSMPRTVSKLRKLGFIDFKGYHAVAETTVTNYVPLMLGITTNHVNWNKKLPKMAGKYDNEPLIWQNFSRLNYVTMDAGDMARWHVFNFNGRLGFTRRQMDFNTRPYFLALEKWGRRGPIYVQQGSYTTSPLNCVNGENVWDFLLDYTYEFLDKFQNVPKFGITWWGWPIHDHLMSLRNFDEPFLNFFERLEQNTSILNDTIVILVGDHGMRYSKYSTSKEGLLERNLPLFTIRLPPRFVQQYPKESRALKENAERLTTHVDVFKTLAHLHRLVTPLVSGRSVPTNASYGYNASYGTSLFSKISTKRTCAEAKIHPSYCSCNYPLWDPNFDYKTYKKPFM